MSHVSNSTCVDARFALFTSLVFCARCGRPRGYEYCYRCCGIVLPFFVVCPGCRKRVGPRAGPAPAGGLAGLGGAFAVPGAAAALMAGAVHPVAAAVHPPVAAVHPPVAAVHPALAHAVNIQQPIIAPVQPAIIAPVQQGRAPVAVPVANVLHGPMQEDEDEENMDQVK